MHCWLALQQVSNFIDGDKNHYELKSQTADSSEDLFHSERSEEEDSTCMRHMSFCYLAYLFCSSNALAGSKRKKIT